jgi:hypothetical protein
VCSRRGLNVTIAETCARKDDQHFDGVNKGNIQWTNTHGSTSKPMRADDEGNGARECESVEATNSQTQ